MRCILFSVKICMPEVSSAKVHEEKTLLEMCLEAMLNEDVDLRKWSKKKQIELAAGDLWTLVEREVITRENSEETGELGKPATK